MVKISPLLKVMDAIRWDDEGLLGRLIILVHAAFLHAGFLLLPLLGRNKRGPVYGRKIVLYVQCAGRQVASSLVAVDALDAARLVALWRGDGKDLARIECSCTALRRLVAERDHELWKPRYEALISHEASDSSETSWKERYVSARRGWLPRTWQPWYRPIGAVRIRLWNGSYVQPSYSDSLTDEFDFLRLFDRDDDPPELPPEDPIPVRRKWTKAARGKRADAGRGLQLQGKRRRGSGAIHAPSSRYRWKHR
ncbi:hypothetical protein QOZ80_5AG0376060 [Eleusine coracana subsp. coracana]|nr:hypothetical protein QOZ80_5AG0376060 [Eleusine coracana subsp. coracana]